MDEKVFKLQRVSDRITLVKLIVSQRVVTFLSVYDPQSGLIDEIKDLFKTGLLKTSEEVCGILNPTVGLMKPGGGMSTWKKGHCYQAKSFQGLIIRHHTLKPNSLPNMQCTIFVKKPTRRSMIVFTPSEVYRLSNQFRSDKADVVGNKPVKNDAGEMSVSEDSKQTALLEYYQRLSNVEFDWDPDHMSNEPPVEAPPSLITIDMVKKAISQM